MYFAENDKRNWFCQKRFGMFIHWGIYSVGGRHEQELWRYKTPWSQYKTYMDIFDPVKFDPVKWLDMIQENNMKYMVITAKHHDGFCMWDTKETSFNIMNTPYKKDIIGMLAEECHKRNFPLQLYYSCVDWHHKAYPNLGRHHEIVTDPAYHNMEEYMDFLKRQIRELCTNYGTIHGIWWDMNVPQHVDPSVNAMIRELQEYAVINNRGYSAGDYSTPERNFTDEYLPFANLTEACDSVGMNSWSYRKDEDYFSVRKLERQIAMFTSLGGNFLLNAGPGPDGDFPAEAKEKLSAVGKWYGKTGEALTASPCPGVIGNKNIICTGGGKTLNLILLDPLPGETLRLESFTHTPEKVVLLNTGEEIPWTFEPMSYFITQEPVLRLRKIPVDRMNGEIPVIRLTFSEELIKRKKLENSENSSGSQKDL